MAPIANDCNAYPAAYLPRLTMHWWDDRFGRNVEIRTKTGLIWLWGPGGQPPDYELTNWTDALAEFIGRYAEATINGVPPCATFAPSSAVDALDRFLQEVAQTPYTLRH